MFWSLLRAVTSGWNFENIPQRLAICRDCEHVEKRPTVDHNGIAGEHLYCMECKCGDHPIAELSTKLGFYNVRCELGKWGPEFALTVKEGSGLLAQRQYKQWQQDNPEEAATQRRESLAKWRDGHPEREEEYQRMMQTWREDYPQYAAEYDSTQHSAPGNNGRQPTAETPQAEPRITHDEPTARPPTLSTDAPQLLGAEQGGAQQ